MAVTKLVAVAPTVTAHPLIVTPVFPEKKAVLKSAAVEMTVDPAVDTVAVVTGDTTVGF